MLPPAPKLQSRYEKELAKVVAQEWHPYAVTEREISIRLFPEDPKS